MMAMMKAKNQLLTMPTSNEAMATALRAHWRQALATAQQSLRSKRSVGLQRRC